MFRILRARNRVRGLVEITDRAALAHELRVVTGDKIHPGAKPASLLQ